jgi:hypothetical protein
VRAGRRAGSAVSRWTIHQSSSSRAARAASNGLSLTARMAA